MENQQEYSIGAFSARVHLSVDTLRYYEKEGLLKPMRNQQNQRVYTENDYEWTLFILRLKQIGMPIREIQTYAKLRYQGDETIHERLQLLYKQEQLLEKQRQEIDEHLAFLTKKMNIYREKIVDME